MQKTLQALAVLLLAAISAAQAAEEDSLQVLLTEVPAQYIEPINTEQTAVIVLKSISAADANLRLGDDNDKISLYYQGRLVKSLRKPQAADDVAAWVKLGGEVLDLALAKSAIARKHDFELTDILLSEAVKSLDKDSKYYAGLDKNEQRAAHKRNFAARLEGDNLYLKVGAFNNFSKSEIVEAIGEYSQAKGLILDLRASPGGQLSAAVEIADLFLDEGIVASVRGRNPEEVIYYNSQDGDIWNGKPMVVLIDGQTSSAAEVLAAALQEQSRALLVGTSSFGKGTIQNLLRLPGGGTLSLSSAYLYTPSGRKLAGQGVVPDICTYEMPESKDIRKLIAAGKDNACGRENRAESNLELEIAAMLLKI